MFGKVFHVYRIENLNTKQVYVGQVASRSVAARWASHLSTARQNLGYDLHEAIRYHGEDNFVCEQIFCAFDRKSMNWAEVELIKEYDCIFPRGYNKTRGGSAGGRFTELIKFRGETFISLADLARRHNVDAQMCHQRIYKYGWSLEQALELEERPLPPPARAEPISVFGKTFESFRKSAEAYGLNEGTVRSRLRNGWPLKSAYGLEPAPDRKAHNAIALEVGGQPFASIEAACIYFGVGRHRYFRHIGKTDWTLEQIFKLSPREQRIGNSQPFNVLNLHFASRAAAARYFGLYTGAISQRIKMGWTELQAVGLEKPPSKKGNHPNSLSIEANGKRYRSLSEAAAAHGLRHQRVSKRLKAGWSVEQALGIERHPKARL
jgi:hypothetical protein